MRRFGMLGGCALLGPILLTGCTGATYLYNQSVDNSYSPTRFGVAAGRKDLQTVVSGDPFGMGQGTFAEATVDVLNRFNPPPQPTHFTLEPGESANLAYRVVLVFDAPGVSIIRLCQDPRPGVPEEAETDGTVHVAAAFCLSQDELTAVQGKVADVESVDDRKFDRLLSQVVIALFPPFDPNQDDGKILRMAGR